MLGWLSAMIARQLQQAVDKKPGDLITVMLEERLEQGSD
jgi:hypothetical protein